MFSDWGDTRSRRAVLRFLMRTHARSENSTFSATMGRLERHGIRGSPQTRVFASGTSTGLRETANPERWPDRYLRPPESGPSRAFRLRLPASRFQAGIELRGLSTQGRNRSLEFAFAFGKAPVDRGLIFQIIGRSAVRLRKRQRREGLDDTLGRPAFPEMHGSQVKRHSSTGQIKASPPLFKVRGRRRGQR